MIHPLSNYCCPSCDHPLCKDSSSAGVTVWCPDLNCGSRVADCGIEAATEDCSYAKLELAVAREMERNSPECI